MARGAEEKQQQQQRIIVDMLAGSASSACWGGALSWRDQRAYTFIIIIIIRTCPDGSVHLVRHYFSDDCCCRSDRAWLALSCARTLLTFEVPSHELFASSSRTRDLVASAVSLTAGPELKSGMAGKLCYRGIRSE